jgi:hypothetical protein
MTGNNIINIKEKETSREQPRDYREREPRKDNMAKGY